MRENELESAAPPVAALKPLSGALPAAREAGLEFSCESNLTFQAAPHGAQHRWRGAGILRQHNFA